MAPPIAPSITDTQQSITTAIWLGFFLGKARVMTFSLPTWANPSCNNMPALSAMYGAGTRLIGLDYLLPLPPGVHYAAAGAIADYQCKGSITLDQGTAMAAAYGVGGGMAMSYVLGFLR